MKTHSTVCYVFLFLLFLTACVPQHKVVYINGNEAINQYENQSRSSIKIKPYDQLYLKVTSLDEKTYNIFNFDERIFSEVGISLNSFSVDDSGRIKLPIIGQIYVKDLTLQETELKIQKAYESYLNNPTVIAKFINNQITVLGYVTRPGTYPFTTEQISIFNALGLAGDITEYGNRKKVILVREQENKLERIEIDLTRNDILGSPYYFLQKNDIIYVEPLKQRYWTINNVQLGLALSSITTFILVLSYVTK
jgi:polysaccharide biosynthesis/export protein